MKFNLIKATVLLLVVINCQAQIPPVEMSDNNPNYIPLLGEIATTLQVKTASSRYFKATHLSFDTTQSPAIVFCNNNKLLPQAEDLYRRPLKKTTYAYHPSGNDLYLEIRIFPPSSQMMMQYLHPKDHLLSDGSGIFLEIIAEENDETREIRRMALQVIREVKERDAVITKLEENLTLENFELLRDYIIKRGQKSSYSGPHQAYQVIFEDDERNVRFTLKQNAKFINQERTDFIIIRISALEVEKSNFPRYQLSHTRPAGYGNIAITILDHEGNTSSAQQKALQDFAKRIEYIKTSN